MAIMRKLDSGVCENKCRPSECRYGTTVVTPRSPRLNVGGRVSDFGKNGILFRRPAYSRWPNIETGGAGGDDGHPPAMYWPTAFIFADTGRAESAEQKAPWTILFVYRQNRKPAEPSLRQSSVPSPSMENRRSVNRQYRRLTFRLTSSDKLTSRNDVWGIQSR